MTKAPCHSQIYNYFPSFSSRPAKQRTEFLWGGTVLLLSLLAFGSSAFAQATFNSATLAFYDHVVNVPSGVKKAWLTNTQTVPITISSIAIGGGNAPGDFVLDAGGDCPLSPSTLGAGDKCNIPVTFTPSALGSRTATLTVTDNATNNPQTVALTGTGVEPVDLTPSPLKFGNQPEGTTGAAKTATLKNYQTATLTNISISASGDYARTGGTCPSSGGTLAEGASCTILLGFTPSILGSDPGTLTVADSASNSPQSIALTGTGTTPVTLSVSSLYLGKTVAGDTSASKSVTLTNKENVSLAFSSIVTSGDFAVSSNTCGTSIVAGATCTVGVTFSPTATGALAGALTFSDNAANSPQTVGLTGIGSSPVTFSPASLTLANTTVGTTSAAKTVTLTNHLTTSLTFSTPVATGDFAVASNTCTSVGPGLTCTVGVTFAPTAVGTLTGTLTIPYGAFGSPSVVTLSGRGKPGPISITVTPANPSINLPLGQTSQQFTATGHFSSGGAQNLTAWATWSSSAPGVATINAAGLASAVGEGLTTIEAALGAINGSTTLNVTRFVWTGSMNTPRVGQTATLLNNGTVLMAGGSGDAAELYNPATGIFSYTGSMNAPRGGQTATLLNNGMVLMAGGNGSAGFLASAELYNPATGTFTYTGSMNTARGDHTATLLDNGLVLMAGGWNYPTGILASAELYDPTTGTFTPTGSLNTERYDYTATMLNNGMVLVAGGFPGIASAELYNPATGTFTPTGSLNAGRVYATATMLNNGMVLMAGGELYWSGYIGNEELYNPATGTFSYTQGDLITPRWGHTAALLNNGMVLVAGGCCDSSGTTASAELYNPSTGTFTPTGGMNAAREIYTATLLTSGMALMAGGYSAVTHATDLSSAELYEPATLTPPNLESIAVTPGTSTLSPGGTQQFIATGTFSDGSTQQLASVTWSTSNPNVAQITNDVTNHGVALAIAKGTVTITATAGTVSGTAKLTVK